MEPADGNNFQSARIPPTDHLQSAHVPPTDLLQSARIPPTDHLQSACVPPTDHLQSARIPPIDHLQSARVPPTDYLQSARVPPTDHLQSARIPPTDHQLQITFMRPSDIRFSREQICERFSDSVDVHHVITKLTFNPKLVNTLPLITVRRRADGEWKSENNRRLYVFRVLQCRGLVDKIQVQVSEHAEEATEREVEGCHVTIHNRSPCFPHCKCKRDDL